MWRITLFVAILTATSLLVTGCTPSAVGHDSGKTSAGPALGVLLLEGNELHASLRTRQLDSISDVPMNAVLPENPYLSTDDEFVEAIARGGSQGGLGGEGIRSALYARYASGETDLGIYGLEAESSTDADQREKMLREIWAFGGNLGRAHVHRKGSVLVVIWHHGVSTECWQSVKATVEDRLHAPGKL